MENKIKYNSAFMESFGIDETILRVAIFVILRFHLMKKMDQGPPSDFKGHLVEGGCVFRVDDPGEIS